MGWRLNNQRFSPALTPRSPEQSNPTMSIRMFKHWALIDTLERVRRRNLRAGFIEIPSINDKRNNAVRDTGNQAVPLAQTI